MIQIDRLTKRYGARVALDDVSFEARAGAVTGLLGPNGAGKSTLMRLIVALDHPTSGRVTIGGRAYATLRQPLRVVGVVAGLTLGNDFVHAISIGEQPDTARMDTMEAFGPVITFAQVAVAGFALHLVTPEYSSGAIGPTLMARPRRRVVLADKERQRGHR